jgi:hypothetical protein
VRIDERGASLSYLQVNGFQIPIGPDCDPMRRLEGSRMTSDTMEPEAFPDLTRADASPPHPAGPGASAPGALLRALLAGAVALLVLLLPAQPAASRGDHDGWPDCRNGACAIDDRAALHDPAWRDRIGEIEIRRRDTC